VPVIHSTPLCETAGLLALPPNARDIAEHLLALKPLSELLYLEQTHQPDRDLLAQHKVPTQLWAAIVKAATLAKVTSFMDNPQFNREEILYLIKAACHSADLPLKAYTLSDVMNLTREKMPNLHHWLIKMAQQLKLKNQAVVNL